MKSSTFLSFTACVSLLAWPALPQADTPLIVNIPGSDRTDLTGINASGTMVGIYLQGSDVYGFIATKPDLSDYVTIDIGAPGGQTFVSGIAADGTLVGS